MRARRLNQQRVDELKPRRAAYEIRDAELKGFGIRILPSGARRYFVHHQHKGKRTWKTFGDAGSLTEPEAREHAASVLAALSKGEDVPPVGNPIFETVAEEVFRRYGRNWKPQTLTVNRGYYRNHILPYFEGRQISDITREDVQSWDSSLHATLVAADRPAPVLSVIMGQAELYGYHPEGSNPCVNIRRYRRRGRERFLSPDELCRLSTRLADNEESDPLVVAAIRLLILTGCPKSEILDLEWRDYREGRLYLRDSKTGCEPAAAKAAAPVDMMDKTLRACPRLHRCNNNRTVTDSGSEDP